MTLSIEIPSEIELALRSQLGDGLEQRAKQDLAISWFRDGRISSRQVAAFLGLSLFEAHAFLKSRGASLPMNLDDVEADLANIQQV